MLQVLSRRENIYDVKGRSLSKPLPKNIITGVEQIETKGTGQNK